jgi:hypothetical protein
MIRDSIFDTQLTKPAIGKVHLHFTADQPFRADRKQPYARPFRPAYVLLNNQATDRLTDDLLKPAWPFALGSCPKVNHDANDADRVPEGAQRIWSRAHGATGLDPERISSNISDFYYAER